MTMTRSRVALLFVQLLCWIELSRASIVRGFATKEIPELQDLPTIADIVRKLSPQINLKNPEEEASSLSSGEPLPRVLQNDEGEDRNETFVPIRDVDFPVQELNPDAGLSFVILMDEFGYSADPIALGTRFGFSGRLATDDAEVGKSSGTCTIGSDVNTDFALCTFYLTFSANADQEKGTLALTGNTDAVGGFLQVTGSGGSLFSTTKGTANLVFDPAGNPVFYIMVRLSSS